MSEIKCLENYIKLKEMFIRRERGDTEYFTAKLQVSKRTFHRLVKCLKEVERINIKFNNYSNAYYLD